MKKMKYFFVYLISVTILLTGCGDTTGSETIKLGINLDLSGAGADYGQAELDGINLALKQFNDKGGFQGKKIEVIVKDNTTDLQEAYRIQTVLAEEGVFAIIGATTSGTSSMAVKASKEQKVPTVSPSATTANVTNENGAGIDFGYRVCFTDEYQGIVMANYASQSGFEKVAILYDNSNDYGKGLSTTFKETYSGTIVLEEYYKGGDEDFSVFWTKLKNIADVDAVFVPGYYEEVGLIIKQGRAVGVELPILGVDGYSAPALLDIAGESALNNVFYSDHFSAFSESSIHQEFVSDFENEYGKKPNGFAALAYDATNIVLDALITADSTDPQKVNEALKNTKDFMGVTGKISFDKLHNAIKSAYIVELKNGVEVDATVVNP